jgi:chromosome partitioning protein
LVVNQSLGDAISETRTEGLALLPGSRSFDDVTELAGGEDEIEERLKVYLIEAASRFEFVIIDCPPSLGKLTEVALRGSNEILMPIQCEYFAMEGLTQMIQVIKRVMQAPGQKLEFGGILLTMYDHTLELAAEVDEEVRDFFGEIVFETVIPRDVAVSEAPSFGRSVIDHAPRARGARAYIELCMEVLEK